MPNETTIETLFDQGIIPQTEKEEKVTTQGKRTPNAANLHFNHNRNNKTKNYDQYNWFAESI